MLENMYGTNIKQPVAKDYYKDKQKYIEFGLPYRMDDNLKISYSRAREKYFPGDSFLYRIINGKNISGKPYVISTIDQIVPPEMVGYNNFDFRKNGEDIKCYTTFILHNHFIIENQIGMKLERSLKGYTNQNYMSTFNTKLPKSKRDEVFSILNYKPSIANYDLMINGKTIKELFPDPLYESFIERNE